MQKGIDQGKIISPILWCIYYDLLLCEIEKHQLGYRIVEKYKKNINDRIYEEESFHMTSLAYMDDTQWITDSQTKLEKILKIADSFYNLNDIQVNKEKSELLIKKKKIRNETFSYNKKIKIIYGNAQIEIKPKHPSESIRIMGVSFNTKNNQNFVVGQAKEEIWNLSNLMKNKRITDKHLLYILNKLIIPRIEYWTQMTVLSKQQNEKIIKPFRKIFKNKLRMAMTAPNAILNNPFIYNYRNLEEIQKQAKITNYLVQ